MKKIVIEIIKGCYRNRLLDFLWTSRILNAIKEIKNQFNLLLFLNNDSFNFDSLLLGDLIFIFLFIKYQVLKSDQQN